MDDSYSNLALDGSDQDEIEFRAELLSEAEWLSQLREFRAYCVLPVNLGITLSAGDLCKQ